MAYDTWPDGIRPTCHHSNSKKKYEDPTCKSVAAHSNYYYEPFDSCGKSVDVALECKAKEIAVFDYLRQFENHEKRLAA